MRSTKVYHLKYFSLHHSPHVVAYLHPIHDMSSFCRKQKKQWHCMFFGGQKVPIRPEYTGQISLENALIWHIFA